MRIGIFGGSFDPVHREHKNCVRAAVEGLRLDKLYVTPAHTPPHKPDRVLSSDADRMEMCRLAFADIPEVEVSDYEISQGGTSYTYLTCRHFKELYPNAELYFLVGTDMLRDFPTWRNPQSIVNDAEIAVCGSASRWNFFKNSAKISCASTTTGQTFLRPKFAFWQGQVCV